MSGRVETVRRTWAAYGRGDIETILEAWLPDSEWEVKIPGWPDQTEFHGHEGIRRYLEEWAESWEEYELELLDVREQGEVLIAYGRQRGRGPDSGAAVQMEFAQVIVFEGELTKRAEIWIDIPAAERRFKQLARERASATGGSGEGATPLPTDAAGRP